ncbi:class I SAM-dependent methyltransferase [Aureimonas sp. AU4]|uniref:class I SAM-dependent methyltransferase n=1 Tax=Aureimonas sp. AU4 TaxID=1638163 RepID=UPI000785EB4E|nr:class I SAM-dependent methyltransferase [Aureimonas sp. AU4]
MSGFDTRWLDLRERADHAARDGALLRAAAAYLAAGGEAPLAVDLGSGTGSTLRAFGSLAEAARWRLVDNDPRLLEAAASRLSGFGAVERVEADLTRLSASEIEGARLVTASALFDLASRSFVEELAALLAERRVALYAALNYDGAMRWDPPLPADDEVVAAFNRHQTGDKGFGPALGYGATEALREAFARQGFEVRLARSPWRLGPGDEALHALFLEGVVAAVAETGAVEPARLADWAARRRAAGPFCEVGHWDVLALPR